MGKELFEKDRGYRIPKFIVILSMLYITVFMFPMMLAYRMVHLGPLLIPGGTIIFPASYFLGDIIAEIYGYQLARQVLWAAIFCQLITGLFILLVLRLPFPGYWHNEPDFDIVLGHAFRYAVASSIGNFIGEFINIYSITKFKVLLKGRYFWLRSMGATCFGEAALTLIVFFLTFAGLTKSSHVAELIVSGYIFKLIFAFIVAFPVTFLVGYLKRAEGIDVYDHTTNFNPFKLGINKEELR